MKKMKKYITVKNNLERIFLSQRVQNKTFQIIKEKQKLIVEYYDSFIAVNITGITLLGAVPTHCPWPADGSGARWQNIRYWCRLPAFPRPSGGSRPHLLH